MSSSESVSLTCAQFREERFLDANPEQISLLKIGEYVRTPLYEPSIRAMRLSLGEVRKQLEMELGSSEKFKEAWRASCKMYEARSSFLSTQFQGPSEYIIAMICFTLDEPYRIYDEFNGLCRMLMTETWCDFPYKSLLYLLIQADMRMRDAEETTRSKPVIRQPITITSGLDYSIEEETEEMVASQENEAVPVNPLLRRSTFRVYRGFDFGVDEKEFRIRNLVAFSHIMPATLDGVKLLKLLEEKGKRVTLLEIDQISWSARYIGALSVFPVEKEVVIWPWVKFYVEKRTMISENVEKIVLRPTSRSFTESAEQ